MINSMKKAVKENLTNRTAIKVRFGEVDSMGIVWHGNYIKYFEDGREAFGDKYGINYMDFYHNGAMIPLVKVVCDYKRPLYYGDTATVETRYINSDAAKIHYEYTIFRNDTDEVVATGMTIQVFVNMDQELLLDVPPFFYEWKKKYGLI
ncbi:MAG: acyl-CoA thioesterase [Bacteroidales bacterium]|nr:acyl-CoA thioesterase [Bacteroidales bacterium]